MTCAVAGLWVAAALAAPPDVSTYQVVQAFADLPEVEAWVDVRDANGATIQDLGAADFRASVGVVTLDVVDVTGVAAGDEPLALVVLLDVSKTMRGAPLTAMQDAAVAVIESLDTLDQAAVVTFGDDVEVVADFGADRQAAVSALTAVTASGDQTVLFSGVERALQMLTRIAPDFPRRRAIALISDGKDEGSGLTVDDLADAGEIAVPVLAVGYSRIGRAHFASLQRLKALSGGAFVESGGPTEIAAALQGLVARLDEALSVTMRAPPELLPDGRTERLQINLAVGATVFPAGRALVLNGERAPAPVEPPPEPPPPEWWQRRSVQAAVGGGVFLLGFAVVGGLLWRGRSSEPEEPAVAPPVAQPPAAPSYAGVVAPVDTDAAMPVAMSAIQIRLPTIVGPGSVIGDVSVTEVGAELGRDTPVAVIGDDEVSSRHCRIGVQHGRLFVEDLGSRNGTRLNGVPVRGRQRLELGDEVSLGATRMRVEAGGA